MEKILRDINLCNTHGEQESFCGSFEGMSHLLLWEDYLAKAEAQDVVVRGVGWQHPSNTQACKVFHLRKLVGEELYPGN